MADLAHLLEEPEEALQQEEEQEWNQDDRETIDLPQIQKEHEKAEVDRLDLDDLVQKDSQTESAYGKLRNLWIQELNSPELLPYDEETIQYLTDAVQAQEDTSEFTGNANVDALLSSIVKVDSERVKFLVSDLLKLRLWKIQSYPLHMRKNIDKMSENEVAFLKEYGRLLETHLNTTVLDHFPEGSWKLINEPEMIDEPNLDVFVFVRIKEDVLIDNRSHEENSCLIVRYNRVRELFHEGKVQLLL